ncbi:MAG: hypothetical protein WD844_12785, partial [Thermoleophilaceae bacterium]
MLLALLALPASAGAQGPIQSSPLHVGADGQGRVQAGYVGATTPLFSPPDFTQQPTGGFHLSEAGVPLNWGPHFGTGFQFIPVTAPKRGGGADCPAGNPCTISSIFRTPTSNLEITEVVSYIKGTEHLRVRYRVRNTSDGPVTFRAWWAADIYPGAEEARGIEKPVSGARVFGGINEFTGLAALLMERTSGDWTHFQEGLDTQVYQRLGSGTPMTNDVDGDLVDAGAGVQFNQHALAEDALGSLQSTFFEASWAFPRFGSVSFGADVPGNVSAPAGTPHTVDDVTAAFGGLPPQHARPFFGEDPVFRWKRMGVNGEDGDVSLVNDSTGVPEENIAWTSGADPGQDLVVGWVDRDNDGMHDGNEPARARTVRWTKDDATPSRLTFDRSSIAAFRDPDLEHKVVAQLGPEQGGIEIRYTVTGANPTDPNEEPPKVNTQTGGAAEIKLKGANAGHDVLIAWADLPAPFPNGQIDPGEPVTALTATWIEPPVNNGPSPPFPPPPAPPG